MDDPANYPRFFEGSGIDPGARMSVSLPEKGPNSGLNHGPAMDEDALALPMVAHIEELRNRILMSVAVLAGAIGLAFVYALPLVELLKGMAPSSIEFVQLTPGEVLVSSLRLAFYMGVALALPVILYNVLRFVLPGLLKREQAMVTWSLLGGTALFAAGTVFAFFFVVPSALGFLVEYGQTVAKVQLSIESYIAFCSALLFVTGAMFELPMVLFLLSFTGIVTSERLIREWRWATVLIFITAAIVTPTQDPASLSVVGFAMMLLYGLSIIPIKLCGR